MRRAALEELKPILTTGGSEIATTEKTAPSANDSASSTAGADSLEQAWLALADENVSHTQRKTLELRLAQHPQASVTALERLVLEKRRPVASAWEPLLERLIPEYHAARSLAVDDLAQRRQAAGELADHARHHPLSRLVLKLVRDHLRHESDPMVWQSLVNAASTSDAPEAAAVNELALEHPIADIRRCACVYFRTHPAHADPQSLLPLVDDESEPVCVAAIDALGRIPDAKTLPTLREKLASPSKAVALAAATALARVRDEQGLAALERWAYDPDAVFRREVARRMAEVGDRTFLGTLVMLLDDADESVRLAALRGLESTWPDIAAQLENQGDTPRNRMAAWRAWYRQTAGSTSIETPFRR
ncbi:MAG: hypothetical protein D6741_12480 [Planctomycetota bacterium]|nr:MAG: hypothetical protein D6741_12480 [Planctomycetota bacterium]